MQIKIISCLNDNYSYLIFEKETNTVAIIDPAEYIPCEQELTKYGKLDFILNTHHHFDHVDGNLKLKKKFDAKILGFHLDKKRIPGIDILLEDNQETSIGNLKFKVIFIPGHTSGHVAFYFEKENVVFTGDTLFSLGCGRIFEGTHKEMFSSLNKLKRLPLETKIYCGHEYTKKNLDFCLKYDASNLDLQKKAKTVISNDAKKSPNIPTVLEEELKTNIFLRCCDFKVKEALNLQHSSEEEIFTKLRDLKDVF